MASRVKPGREALLRSWLISSDENFETYQSLFRVINEENFGNNLLD